MNNLFVALFSIFVVSVTCTCPAPPAGIPNFDRSRFLGTWNVIAATGPYFDSYVCDQRIATTGTIMNVEFSGNEISGDEVSTAYSASRYLRRMTGSSALKLTATGTPNLNFVVLQTDYDNNAVVYYCYNIPRTTNHISNTEVWTKANPIVGYLPAIMYAAPILEAQGINSATMDKVNHIGCESSGTEFLSMLRSTIEEKLSDVPAFPTLPSLPNLSDLQSKVESNLMEKWNRLRDLFQFPSLS